MDCSRVWLSQNSVIGRDFPDVRDRDDDRRRRERAVLREEPVEVLHPERHHEAEDDREHDPVRRDRPDCRRIGVPSAVNLVRCAR